MVDIRSVDPTILIDLRYAGSQNIAHRPLYPSGMPALIRPSVGRRLVAAQAFLREHGFSLKIWDAYRPKAAHEQLWAMSGDNSFVANPADGVGSLHTRGAAVDTTIVDSHGGYVPVPTDFDVFTPAALLHYAGADLKVRADLRMLQRAMGRAGFLGLRTEWWHFVAPDWQSYPPIPEVNLVPRQPAAAPATVATKPAEPTRGRPRSF